LHHQQWDILRPYNTLSDVEVSSLASEGVYVTGFTGMMMMMMMMMMLMIY